MCTTLQEKKKSVFKNEWTRTVIQHVTRFSCTSFEAYLLQKAVINFGRKVVIKAGMPLGGRVGRLYIAWNGLRSRGAESLLFGMSDKWRCVCKSFYRADGNKSRSVCLKIPTVVTKTFQFSKTTESILVFESCLIFQLRIREGLLFNVMQKCSEKKRMDGRRIPSLVLFFWSKRYCIQWFLTLILQACVFRTGTI